MKPIFIEDFNYELPDDRIAQEALMPRDSSRLLVFNNGIKDANFRQLSQFIPENSNMYFNNAKVIPARVLLKNKNNANIEVFLLQPFQSDYFTSLTNTSYSVWECLIGNKKKWSKEETLSLFLGPLKIEFFQKENQIVEIKWNLNITFLDVLEQIGQMPLPPYIKRQLTAEDENRYQTIYSKNEGSVAAPTAGLHFTEYVFEQLKTKQIAVNYLTLHVSAGTFLPVKSENAMEHNMHLEYFSIDVECINSIETKKINIAVGTTSVRVLESIYWCGVNLIQNKEQPFNISQFLPFQFKEELPSLNESLSAIKKYLKQHQIHVIQGTTSIMIVPGYEFKVVDVLITNFHQPKSTLMLLVAAFVGDNWKTIYQHALSNNYRFLSYGDSSILFKQ